LALALARIVLDVALARQVAAEPHRDRARGDLGQSRRDDQRRRIDGAGQAGGQREGDRQAVRQADDHTAHDQAGPEVRLDVRRVWYVLSTNAPRLLQSMSMLSY